MSVDPALNDVINRFVSPMEEGGGITPDEFEQLAAACDVRLRSNAMSSTNGMVNMISTYGIRFEYTKGRAKPRFLGLIKARSKVRQVVEAHLTERSAAFAQFSAEIEEMQGPAGVDL